MHFIYIYIYLFIFIDMLNLRIECIISIQNKLRENLTEN